MHFFLISTSSIHQECATELVRSDCFLNKVLLAATIGTIDVKNLLTVYLHTDTDTSNN